MKWKDGSTYRGQWLFGKAFGKGVFSFPNGDQFDGNWTCDKTLTPITAQKIEANGYMWLITREKGIRSSPDSDGSGQVTAAKINKIKQALASIRQQFKNPANLQTFTPKMLQGREHQREEYKNGDYYEGTFLNGKKDGVGKKTWVNGDVHDGEWKNNCQHGWGVTDWKDGSRFIGMFAQDLKEGIGKYEWEDGSKFIGEWKQNLMQGVGKYKWPDGRSYAGYWSNGMMHGLGMFKWPEGKRFEGYWALGKKNGNGITYYPDGRKSLDIWKNGNKTSIK